ncbi:RAMP superfamily CRISPR-associated protein [uncultured Thiohalocapsa sp.]|uniref:RAMP superfamily CRISPR-associated protein n=1 Tax=uncultured Thiohalocapsa sp. TaxID=768990 RepID=UPI0025FB0EF8|nr:RAMP superfamily CRISPR-associated protein [uncultured Thiohalocapsa sp.]
MSAARLSIDIRGDWHPGTGAASGFHLDARAHVGADGCPRLPGRTLKGLLRDALWRAEHWGWTQVPAGSTDALFGTKADDEQHSTPGLLRVSDATLPEAVRAYLAGDEGAPLRDGLFREHFSTAIDDSTGVALGRTLRGMQVVVPLTLAAHISEVPGVAPVPDWPDRLAGVLPLVNAVGASRTRGFGRAVLTLTQED